MENSTKKAIDGMDYHSMVSLWRSAPVGHPYFQGDTGDYYSKIMAEKRKQVGPAAHVAASKAIGWCWLLLICLLIISGCAGLEHIDKDGNITRYFRIGDQSIGAGNIKLPDGSVLTFEEQKSELPKVEITATSITIGGKVVGQ